MSETDRGAPDDEALALRVARGQAEGAGDLAQDVPLQDPEP